MAPAGTGRQGGDTRSSDPARRGRLILAATPLGNPGDASARLCQALGSAAVIAAEDTRRLHRLAADLGVEVTGRVVSLHDSVEAARTATLLRMLAAGDDVLVVSDAGMPAVSDPGYRIVRAAIDEGIEVSVLPGPSAVLAALVLSGLPVDRFAFEGFPPRKAGERRRAFGELAQERRTMVFFESPHRIAATLADMAEAFGAARSAAIVREITKTHEEVLRGDLATLAHTAAEGLRGEITLVVAGAVAAVPTADPQQWVTGVQQLVDSGVDRREAIGRIARSVGAPRREVYDAVVAARRDAARP